LSRCRRRVSPLITNEILHGFVVDAAINGVGSVVVFLPQIVILFAFILTLEQTGYMVRAAFVMDELMPRGPVRPGVHSVALLLCLRHSGHHGDADD
jgi:Fe2+ transport system protein B